MKKLFAALASAAPLVVFAQQVQPASPASAQPSAAAAVPQPYAPPPQYTGQYGQPPTYAPGQTYPPPVYRRPDQRDAWYIGFGLGGADGSLKLSAGPFAPSGGTHSFREYLGASPTTVSVNLKVGATLSPTLLLGADVTAVRSAASDQGIDVAVQITNYDLVATFFPYERGFFVRGGAGLAKFSYDVSGQGASLSDSASGLSLLAGLGYAFWLGQHFNLTLNLDYAYQSYSGKDVLGALPESSSMWALWVGFDWY